MGTSSSKGESNRGTENQSEGLQFNTLQTVLPVNSNRTSFAESYPVTIYGSYWIGYIKAVWIEWSAGSCGKRRKIAIFLRPFP